MSSDLLSLDDLGLNSGTTSASTIAAPTIPAPSPAPSTRRRSAQSPTQPRARTVQKGVLFFDLETIPDYSREVLFDLQPIPEPAKRATVEEMADNPPGALLKRTLTDIGDVLTAKSPCDEYLTALQVEESRAAKPRKGVFDAIAKVRGLDAAREGLIEARRKEMATSPEMCRIVAFGWKCNGDSATQSLVVNESVTEVEILERFWSLATSTQKVCGFNIAGFDLPVIFLRSILLGVAPTRLFDLRPWGNDCIDLMALRFPKSGAKRLKWIAKAMGLEIPAGDIDGSQVEQLYLTDPATVGVYVRSDVELAEQIYHAYRGFFC